MQPIVYDTKLVRGDDFSRTFRVGRMVDGAKVFDIDFTGHTGLAQLRRNTDATVVLLTFAVTIPDQSVTGNKGKFTITATKVQTAALTVESGVYDVQLTSGSGQTTTWATGRISVIPDVSRP